MVCLLCVFVLCSCTGVATESGHVSLDATCTANSAGQTSIKVTIKNGTADHLSVVVGGILGNGDRLAYAVSLQVTPLGAADAGAFDYSDPRHPGVAGRMDPWRLEVPPRGLTYFDVDAGHFLSPRSGQRFSTARRADVRLRLRGLGSEGHELSRPWTGTVESQPMRMPESCKSSAEK
jgi:hypothetical protein